MAVSWLTWAVLLTAVGLFIAWMLRPDPSLPPRVPAADTDYTRKPGLSGLMPLHAPATGLRYVVIGTGSVGLRMVDALLERGEAHVVGVDVAPPRRIPPGMKFVRASATDYAAVRAALDGADVCFATFALIRPWERLACLYGPSHAVNVAGTENVVRACADAGVRVLVHTSTSNVAVSPKLPMRMLLDESAPTVDARTTANHYSWTKAQAERAVLRANGTPLPAGRGLLATGSIRPCSGARARARRLARALASPRGACARMRARSAESLAAAGACARRDALAGLFGPEDVNLCERWLSAEHAYVTAGNQVIDWVYVDDVVWGHLLLERSLLHNPTRAGARGARAERGARRAACASARGAKGCARECAWRGRLRTGLRGAKGCARECARAWCERRRGAHTACHARSADRLPHAHAPRRRASVQAARLSASRTTSRSRSCTCCSRSSTSTSECARVRPSACPRGRQRRTRLSG